jgi:phage terminase large subunit
MILQPWAKSWWHTPARYKIAYGGRGSGKSWALAYLCLLFAQRGFRILCAREYQASIADSVYRLMIDLITREGLGGFTVTRAEIKHSSGGLLFFRGLARNPHSVKSSEGINIVWVEEAQAVSEESWRQLIPTIRAVNSEIWVSYNPRYLNDPTCQRFYGENAPKGAIVSIVNWDNNPFFPDVLKAELARDYERDPERARHVWGGDPLSSSAAQVLNGKWIVQDFTPGKDWDGPYYGIDWGITDPTVGVKCWAHNDCLYIENEVYARGADDVVALLRGLPGLREHAARADSSWPETIEHVKRAGFPRLTACEKWQGSVEDGISWLRGRKQIVIHPKCTNTIREAGLWRYKTDAGDNVLPRLQSGDDHSWDAVRYAMQQLIKKKTSVTPTFQSVGKREF